MSALLDNSKFRNMLEVAARGGTVVECGLAMGLEHSKFAKMLLEDRAASVEYERARAIGIDYLVDTLVKIPDEEPDVQRATLKSNNIKWVASKRKPQTYGDKLDVSVTGSVDLTAIMAERMAKLRPMRDLNTLPAPAQPVESIAYEAKPNDSVSVDVPAIDPASLLK